MTEFERLTQSPETLGAFLASLPVVEGPWDAEFQAQFCAECAAEDCVACPCENFRNNPLWWLTLAAERTAEPETHAIDLDPAEVEKPLTAEEEAEAARLLSMFRYFISDSAELTEQEIAKMEASEEEKTVYRFLAKNNPENRVIEIGMCGKPSIRLHGAADVEAFITLIRDQSRTAFRGDLEEKELVP